MGADIDFELNTGEKRHAHMLNRDFLIYTGLYYLDDCVDQTLRDLWHEEADGYVFSNSSLATYMYISCAQRGKVPPLKFGEKVVEAVWSN